MHTLLRSVAAAAFALVPFALSAQVVSTETIVHGPYLPSDSRIDRLAIAGDESEQLVAWAGTDDVGPIRVSVKRVGSPTAQQFALTTENATRTDMPTLVKLGERYLLAWREEFVTPNQATPFTPRHRTLAARLDANAQRIDGVPYNLHETAPIVDPTSNIFATATANDFRVYTTQGLTYESRILPDGGLADPTSRSTGILLGSDAASNGRAIVFATFIPRPAILILPQPPSLFEVWVKGVDLTLSSASRTFSHTVPMAEDSVPSIATNGHEFLVVWREYDVIRAQRLNEFGEPLGVSFVVSPVTPARPNTVARVEATWNGSQYVLAWETTSAHSTDIMGATIGAVGPVANVFPIATTTAEERLPAITSLGGGRAMVAYQLYRVANSQIAVRTIGDRGRGRAIGRR